MIKKLSKIIAVFAVMLTVCLAGSLTANASGEYAILGGGGSVSAGESVSVSVSITNNDGLWGAEGVLSYDPSVIEFSGGSGATVNGGGGQIRFVQDFDGSTTSAGITITFTAVGSGDANVSLAACTVMGQGSAVDCSGGIAPVSVGAPTQGGSSDNNNKQGSSNSTLKSLSISPGKLTPAFSSGVYNYKARVAADVTSVTVSAETTDPNAEVTAVYGAKLIEPGDNTVSVVVTGADGSQSTYVISIFAGESEVTASDVGVTVKGKQYMFADEIPEDVFPDGFEETAVKYNNKDVKALKFAKADVYLVYLVDQAAGDDKEDKEGKLFVYDQVSANFYPFVKLGVNGSKYIIPLVPNDKGTLPAGYVATIGNFNDCEVTVYGKSESTSAISPEFYLIYSVDSDGVLGWYQYDTKDGIFQRFDIESYNADQETLVSAVANLKAFQDKYHKQMKLINIIIAGLGALLLILIIGLAVANTKRSKYKRMVREYEEENEDDFSWEKKVSEGEEYNRDDDEAQKEDKESNPKSEKALPPQSKNEIEADRLNAEGAIALGNDIAKIMEEARAEKKVEDEEPVKIEPVKPEHEVKNIELEDIAEAEDDFDYDFDDDELDDDFEIFTL